MNSKNLKINNKNGVVYITFPLLSKCGVVKHAFSTRMGGVSKGQFSTMNLSFGNGDNADNVMENYRRICAVAGINPNHLVLSRQTHTSNVVTVTADDIGRGITKESYCDVDGLVTAEKGIALVTQYADCTPLLFCDPVKKVIATSHAGWRGTVAEIGKVTVEKMVNEFGCERENIIAGIGPCIGKCCYEVDMPVYNEFCKIPYINPKDIFTDKGGGKFMLDLPTANRLILLNAGIKQENIDFSDICTCCNSQELHSHRATNGKRGNLAAIIELV